MDTLQVVSFNTVDAFGFHDGRIAEAAVSDVNVASVVQADLPSSPLGQFQQWRWVGGEWVASTDYRGHSWYDPASTDRVHQAARFDDAPPDGWVYWAPGENRVVGSGEQAGKQWSAVRLARDRLLSESDWIVTKSAEQGASTPAEWVQYRQALRDITSQADPFNIAWPLKPESNPQITFVIGPM